MSKIWDLLKRTQAIAAQVNVRLAIVAVVLGVGGFAVYKGVQQMKPGTPTPKKVAKAGEEAKTGATVSGAAPEGAVGAEGTGQTAPEEPLYGAAAPVQENGPAAYGSGGEVAPTGGITGESGASEGGATSAYGAGGNPSDQLVQEVPAEEQPATGNRLRPPTRPAGGGVYSVNDGNSGSEPPVC